MSLTEVRTAGRLQRGGEFEFGVLLAQVDEPLPHAAGGAVDCDDRFHE